MHRRLIWIGMLAALMLAGSARAQSGAGKIYATKCASCHGLSGGGDGPRAALLKAKPHSFRDCDWMSMMSDATLFLAIERGPSAVGMRAEMPGFDGRLDDKTIAELVAYIRGFCPPGSNPRFSARQESLSERLERGPQ